MLNYFLVGLGGALGSMARFWVSGWGARYFSATFPYGTLLINVTGSFLIGFLATMVGPEGRWLAGPGARSFFMAGLCGGYTTFSAFSLETLNLARDGQWVQAGANALLSFTCCLGAVWLGHLLALSMSAKGA